ncbi:MAG: IS200/IS605 family accessory protein TnpB-related protein [Truepera sp.]|nr:IS200/IS605 family accessory protein TnpB-related protein [Truepera sp.]
MAEQVRTYQTRINVTAEQEALLSEYATIFGKAERTLFARLQAGEEINALKRDFQQCFGITARQFNAINAQLSGRVRSIKEMQLALVETLTERIEEAEKELAKITKPAVLHQKKRRLARLQYHLAQLKEDTEAGRVRLCFGSKKLFRAQFRLKENGYKASPDHSSHAEWLKDWQQARANQFLVLGSKDETAGCQGCVATVAEDGGITLKLRLPNSLLAKHTVIEGLSFAYGQPEMVAAIGRNLSADQADWQPISYRFMRDEKGWRVFVTVSLPRVKLNSDYRLGVIGIDLNADSLAVTETDRCGNPLTSFAVPCVTYGKSASQRKAVIGEAVKQIIAFAKAKGKPLVVERLDFEKKKAALEQESPRYARMLSSLAYRQLQAIIRARAFDAGIQVFEVNPAFTSVIGRYKFQHRYGLSAHTAAALVIGRRSLGLRESLPSQLQGTLPLSARKRGRHVWSRWAALSKTIAAHAAHGRSGQSRSSPSPGLGKARLVTILPVAGETPAGESSAELFG